MKIKTTPDLSNLQSLEELTRFTAITFNDVVSAINGRLDFVSNCITKTIGCTFTVGATTVAFEHGLGQVPNGYIVVGRDSPLEVYDGVKNADATSIYLQGSTTGFAKILVY